MSRTVNLAIVGATGNVGRTFLKVLEERDFPYHSLTCFASAKSAGSKVTCKGVEYTLEELTPDSFKGRGFDIALFSAGGDISKDYAPLAAEAGAVVIDNSSAWRMDPEVPLVVPEVNPEEIFKNHGIIANPNCSTIQAVVALKPLQEKYGIKRIVYSTYQAVSGSGVKGVTELAEGLKGNILTKAYPHSIHNNCLPQIDVFVENGYTKEEMKMILETQKILKDDTLRITATTVRVPIFNCHSESVNVELKKPFELEELVELLKQSPGLVVMNDHTKLEYPLASIADDTDPVYVGRIRRDESLDNGVNLWIVADNIRKGAATNAVQIAEVLVADRN